jgi:hypothetical protein
MMSAMYYTNMFNWSFIVQAPWNNILPVDITLHSYDPDSDPTSLCSYSL